LKCNSTGLVVLTFLESTIFDFVWHTPRERAWKLRLPTDFFKSPIKVDEDWQPNQPGKNFQPWEVAALLNVLEPISVLTDLDVADNGTAGRRKVVQLYHALSDRLE
jgi:hypothetical protein